MKQYPKYKDSKISWIGDVPEYWGIHKIREHFRERKEKVSDKDFAPLSVAKIGIVPQLEDACKTDNGDNRKLVRKGDFVVNSRSDRKGSCGISPLDGSVSLINIVLTPYKINSGFVHYLLRSNDYIEEFYRSGRGIVADLWTTRYSEMRNIFIPYPPADEQQAIVEFLDTAVDKIDRYIAVKEAEIEKLGTLKQSVISQAVTKGLNPASPMKDSGIPWIGDVPEHWKKMRYKDLLNPKDVRVGNNPSYTLLSLTKQGVIVRDLSEGKGKFPKDFDTYKVIEPNDFILCLFDVDETPRTVGFAKDNGMITGAYNIFSVSRCDLRYLYYHYLSLDDKKSLKPLYKGLRKTIPLQRLLSAYIYMPPANEQQAIVNYIDEQVQKIDTSISNIRQQIEKLKVYKQRLISDAVTGKIDVRERLG